MLLSWLWLSKLLSDLFMYQSLEYVWSKTLQCPLHLTLWSDTKLLRSIWKFRRLAVSCQHSTIYKSVCFSTTKKVCFLLWKDKQSWHGITLISHFQHVCCLQILFYCVRSLHVFLQRHFDQQFVRRLPIIKFTHKVPSKYHMSRIKIIQTKYKPTIRM